MRRRAFLVAGASIALGAPARLLAQTQTRPGWSATGPLEGREPADLAALTPEEQRHAPVLVLPETVRAGRPFDVVLQVGVDPHVMAEAHRIDWIELAVDERRAFVADLGPEVAFPVLRLSLVLAAPATLTARAYCSLHGPWRTRRRVEVR